MILQATPHQAPPPAFTVAAIVENCEAPTVFEIPPLEGDGFRCSVEMPYGDSFASEARSVQLPEEYDWTQPKVLRQYIRLEQKVLSQKADPSEQERYESMKADRNSRIFADRVVQDYAEIQRLKLLAEKLADIQRYLRPIPVG